MNKRPLIFVIAITLSLFALNQLFDWQSNQRRQELLAEIRKKDQETLEKSASELRNKIAPLQDLPIVTLYEDESLSTPASLAVQQNNDFLTISWKHPLPQDLYIHEKKLSLQNKNVSTGDPAIYSSSSSNGLFLGSPPTETSAELQLVYFTDNNLQAGVTLGVLDTGRFIGSITQPPSNCIALYKNEGKYLPYGIYRPSTLNFERLATTLTPPDTTSLASSQKKPVEPIAGERFFVLENQYIQLVFSNIGGSLSEINLPFQSDTNKNSVVLPIQFDQRMASQHPQNDCFPMNPYYKPGSTMLSHPKVGGYYPLLRRSIIGQNNRAISMVPPRYYALNLSSNAENSESLSRSVYTLKRFDKDLIEFELVNEGHKITKTYTLPRDSDNAPYCFELTLKHDGNTQGLEITSGIPEVELISDTFSPSIKYRFTGQKKSGVTQVDLPKGSESLSSVTPEWISDANGFFGLIINPVQTQLGGFSTYRIPGDVVPTRLTMIDAAYELYPADKYPGYEVRLPVTPTALGNKYRIFAGPYVKEIFEKVDATYYDASTNSSPQFESAISFHGWFSFISEPFAKFLLLLLKFFYFVSSSWGISIILLTIALRIMLYPLNTWSIRSTMKMQEVGPQVQALQARYKKDPKRAQMEIMHLYREKGVNPISGCFPLLIQLPFLIGMFDLLKSTFELRGAGFIPGWINNLTAPDVIFSWEYPIFFIGNQFHLLPILLGGVMYLQQRYSSSLAPASQIPMTDQQRQQKFMGNIMTIVFTLMFYNFPSGLNIYWLSSMLLGILQQWLMTKKTRSKPIIEVLK
ncbi:MAG: membrane protein insertase YidC [Simkania sp.]|nr:membrane protein insertase YidC [Simkania sp.]